VDIEQLPALIVLTVVCLFAALGLWYLGIRRGSLGFKQVAVMVGLIPVLVIGLQFLPSSLSTPDFRDVAVGPPSGEPSTSSQVPFPVNNATVKHQLELRPEIRGSNPPVKPVHLKFTVRSPKGETISQGEGDLAPAQKRRWKSLLAEFQPHEQGEHTLIVEVPQPVSSVDVFIREIHK
jgi:hypothetical protein